MSACTRNTIGSVSAFFEGYNGSGLVKLVRHLNEFKRLVGINMPKFEQDIAKHDLSIEFCGETDPQKMVDAILNFQGSWLFVVKSWATGSF